MRIESLLQLTLRSTFFQKIKRNQKFYHNLLQQRTTRSRGIIVSIARWLKPKEIFRDRVGNYLLNTIEFDGKVVLVASCYLPNANKENKSTWERLHNDIKTRRRKYDQVIICGDFNLILNHQQNSLYYRNENNKSAKRKLREIISEFKLVDSTPNVKYTQRGTLGTFGKLDYVLMSEDLSLYVSDYKSKSFVGSDHDAQHVCIETPSIKPINCYKVNVVLINDEVVSRRIVNSVEDLQLMNLDPSNLISGILNSSKIIYKEEGRKRAAKNKDLKQKIENLTEAEIAGEDNSEELKAAIEEYKRGSLIRIKSDLDPKLAHIQKLKAAEKASTIKKNIVGVRREDDSLCKDPSECANRLCNHYRDKNKCYDCKVDSTCERCNSDSADFTKKIITNERDRQCLSNKQKSNLEKQISVRETLSYLSKLSKNPAKRYKTPGPDGLPLEFYIKFRQILAEPLTKMYNDAIAAGKMDDLFTSGYLTLIPKKGDPTYIKNMRPISLLNCVYKIFTGILTARLNKVLGGILHPAQKGFLNDRKIEDVNMSLNETARFQRNSNAKCTLAAIDFKSAFDTISHREIILQLRRKNFGEWFIRAIGMILLQTKMTLLIGGGQFYVKRGVKQGDVCSPALFILVLDRLIRRIHNDNGINSPIINGKPHKVEAFADDMTIILSGNAETVINSYKTLVDIVEDFGVSSGMMLNEAKTEITSPFNERMKESIPSPSYVEHLDILGTCVSIDGSHAKQNERNILNKLRAATYHYVDLVDDNVISKAKVWNTFVLPKVTHILNVTPYSRVVANDIRKICRDFLSRENGSISVSYDRLSTHRKRGGIGLINIDRFWKALNAKWIKKLKSSGAIWATNIKKSIMLKTNSHFNKATSLGMDKPLQIIGSFGPFWSTVVRNTKPLFKQISEGMKFNEPITGNAKFAFMKQSVIYNKVGIVADLFNLRDPSPMDEVENQIILDILGIDPPGGTVEDSLSLYDLFIAKSNFWIKKNLGPDGFERNKELLTKHGRIFGSPIPPVAAIHLLNNPLFSDATSWFKLKACSGSLMTNVKTGRNPASQKCFYCPHPETTAHFLCECPATQPARDVIKSNVLSAWNINIAQHQIAFLYSGRKATEINAIIAKTQCITYAYKFKEYELDDSYESMIISIIKKLMPPGHNIINFNSVPAAP